MKKAFTLFLSLFCFYIANAQTQKMTYQAVVRNANNELVTNQQIGIQISIIEDNANGPIAYSERHTVQTNANALFSIVIGTGTPLLINSMADIKWDKHDHYMRIEIDLTGGTNYTITGTQQLLSVPYSLYSNKSKYVDTALYSTNSTSAIHSTYADSSLYSYSAIYSTHTDSSLISIYAINAIYADTTLYAYNAVHSDTAGYAAISNNALNATYSDTSLYATNSNHSVYADTALYANNSANAVNAHNAVNATYADTAFFLMNAQNSDTAKFAYHSDSANYATTANYSNTAATAVNATYSDTSIYANNANNSINAINATYSDTSLYATNSNHSVYADTAKFAYHSDTTNYAAMANYANSANYADSSNYNHLSNRPVGTNRGDILYWEPNDSSWHIIPAGNAGETLTMDTNSIPHWASGNSQSALPIVTTDSVNHITGSTAQAAGSVAINGVSSLIISGICWSTSSNPTTADNYTIDKIGNGSFIGELTNLSPGTVYYARAYATNDAGTSYGDTISFTTPAILPSLSTTSVSSITGTTAISGGNITSDGGSAIISRGVCWSTSPHPTISNSKTSDGAGTGIFQSNISNLNASTVYYVRAYATNSIGTSYGEEFSFTTTFTCGLSIKDIDNNTYNTVSIGSQCWMKENLKTSRYANGTQIMLGSTSNTSETMPYRYYPNGSKSNVNSYGYLYNWAAVMNEQSSSDSKPSGVQGICPNGWHVPSNSEWTQLINYVKGQSAYWCNSSSNYYAKSLASTTGWSSTSSTCAIGNTPANNNSTGFSAMPAGSFYGNGYNYFGQYAYIWSSTIYNNNGYVYRRSMSYSGVAVYNSSGNSGDERGWYGFSVRCLKD